MAARVVQRIQLAELADVGIDADDLAPDRLRYAVQRFARPGAATSQSDQGETVQECGWQLLSQPDRPNRTGLLGGLTEHHERGRTVADSGQVQLERIPERWPGQRGINPKFAALHPSWARRAQRNSDPARAVMPRQRIAVVLAGGRQRRGTGRDLRGALRLQV
jgi:hypothetical protein